MTKLTPIENPPGLFLKLVYFISRRKFGKVLSPISVIYSRSLPLIYVALKIDKIETKLALPIKDVILIRNLVSNQNNCSFCSDLSFYYARKSELGEIMNLLNFRTNAFYTKREKVMLQYVEEINLTHAASQETLDLLGKHFSEREIVEITWVCATENYFNMLAKPLGLTSDDLKNRTN